eukprot:COSAG02_NODE_6166_length_3754_cov_34.198906_6_plen_48_part_00
MTSRLGTVVVLAILALLALIQGSVSQEAAAPSTPPTNVFFACVLLLV